jgi:glycogen synthase
MPEMRVLMTGDTVGGVWTFTLELAEGLQQRGIQVWLAVMGGIPNRSQCRDAARIPGLRVFGSNYKLEWMQNAWDDVAESGRWVLSLADQYQPDIVHLNTFGHAALPWKSPTVLTAHSCVTSWWAAAKSEDLPAAWDRYRRCVARSLEASTVVTAPSVAMANALEQHYGLDRRKLRVIYNGRKNALFARGPKEPMILAAGRLWDEGKNIAQLASVASELPWPVYIAGESRDPSGRTQKLAGCHILGPLSPDRLHDWYRRASIYALPARYEPFGYSALEAALSGCALVLGDIPSLRELWGDSATFVPPADGHALRSALAELISQPALRERMASLAHRRARRFTADRMASAYADVYRKSNIRSVRRQACAS